MRGVNRFDNVHIVDPNQHDRQMKAYIVVRLGPTHAFMLHKSPGIFWYIHRFWRCILRKELKYTEINHNNIERKRNKISKSQNGDILIVGTKRYNLRVISTLGSNKCVDFCKYSCSLSLFGYDNTAWYIPTWSLGRMSWIMKKDKIVIGISAL